MGGRLFVVQFPTLFRAITELPQDHTPVGFLRHPYRALRQNASRFIKLHSGVSIILIGVILFGLVKEMQWFTRRKTAGKRNKGIPKVHNHYLVHR